MGLNEACESARTQERDSTAAGELVLHHAGEVAADCERSSAGSTHRPLSFYACITYQKFLEGALAELLADDDAAYDLVCGEGNLERPDRASFAHMACFDAESLRKDRIVRKLLADTTTLDAYCAKTPERDREFPFSSACFQRRLESMHAGKRSAWLANKGAPGRRRLIFRLMSTFTTATLSCTKSRGRTLGTSSAKAKADKTYPKRKRGDLY